ncbi:hypothetical protein BDZ89DRAFT_703683 [Hymenopellis radicata]|nr:hypothetical protein BDZ89DRAFT_703683 [Hymenopellis radicata]
MVPGPDKHSIPEMCLPLSPNVHPWGRDPLQSDPPLPWPDCFHVTLAVVNAVTKYEFKDTRERGKYCLPETPRLSASMSVDDDWKQLLDSGDMDLAAGDPNKHQKLDIKPSPPGHWDLWAEEETSLVATSEPQTTVRAKSEANLETENDSDSAWESGSASDSSSLRTASMEHEDFEDPRPRLPVIKCCVDLETVPIEEIGNPWDLMKELDVLKQLEQESKERVQEKIKAVANMDAELDVLLKRTRSLLSLTKKSDSGSDHSNNGIDVAQSRENEEVPTAVDSRAPRDGDELAAPLASKTREGTFISTATLLNIKR